MSGKLYGVGVGPGDPELLTLKAIRIIKESDIIAIPVSNAAYANVFITGQIDNTIQSIQHEDSCVSYQIVKQVITDLEKKDILYLPMPMTKDKNLLRACHDYGMSFIKEKLDKNHTISFLTIGDPSVYSTYLYVHKRALSLGYDAKLISGVPSFCAVAARLNQGLVENAQELHIIPASYQIEEALSLNGTKVFMKTGKNFTKVKEHLSNMIKASNSDNQEQSHSIQVVENCGMDNEAVYHNIHDIGDSLSYYSMIVVKEN